jgi:hypothetical protein
MRLRKSSNPKLMLGSWSAMDGASCEEARMVVLSEGSKVVMVGVLSQGTLSILWCAAICDYVVDAVR